ncbi:Tripartite-type tricarboxylate transporter, receptor component TctC [Tranquillimonas rosea]|uniref:Tripartite-type tricarboxylate transporter, receptor component TctC n=1 Tax=Tranquillimonas rosea TaxID=641238 RepID=A0A1H9X941_9RHOB|nr:tripartite tricarboxylate transporter substrate binding protein [Tranquillimonas rosea]SES42589.1 Tripartite-type tricarboxylate transporter, receptor component TctC [Tranquillimonas rosea]
MFKTTTAIAAVALGLAAGPLAAQEDFPNDTVTIIVPYGAGGGTDNFVRALEGPLEEAFGTDVAVRNIAGGGGAVGLTQTLTNEPDGYTVTIPNNAFYTLVGMGNVNFELDDFDYIARLVTEPYVLTLGESENWSDLESFVDYAEEEPVTLGFAGVGSSSHIMTLAIADALGVQVQFVPYGGGSEATAAALGGHIDGVVLSPSDVVSAIEGEGGLTPVASTGESSLLPDVPLFSDGGVDVTADQWRGIAAPAGVDQAVIDAWEAALKEAVQDESFQQAVDNLGVELAPLYGDELQQFVQDGSDLFLPLTESVAQQ